MLKMVATPEQVLDNIRKFEVEVKGSPDLQARLAYARAWYAEKDERGRWHFGPSKFIGYQDIDAKIYLAKAEDSDGRRTEAQLQSWFKVVGAETALHAELTSALVTFLSQYGKAPSTKARISVGRERRRLFLSGNEGGGTSDVVRLIVAVAKNLPEEEFRELREQLEEIWS
jgi:hypothetical protein